MHELIELKQGWVIRKPVGFTWLDMARCRFDPVSLTIAAAQAVGSAASAAGAAGIGIATSVGGGSAVAGSALIAGTGLTAMGAIQQGRLAKAEGSAQNKIAQFNALQSEREAHARMEAAKLEETRVSRQAKLFRGEQRARMGKSGISLTEGSPLELQADTAYQFALDRALTLRGGLLDKGSFEAQAGIQRAEGKWASGYGKAASKNYYMQAGASILGGAYSAYKMNGAGIGAASNQSNATLLRY